MSEDPRLSGLYREGAEEEPPAHLDAAIRAAARREAGARPRAAMWSPFPAGWRMPMALAALLVVAATVVTLVMEERREEPHVTARMGERAAPKAAVDVADAAKVTNGPSATAAPSVPPAPVAQAPAGPEAARSNEERFVAEPPPAGERSKLARADSAEAVDRRAPAAPASEVSETRRQAPAEQQAQARDQAAAPRPAPPAPMAEAPAGVAKQEALGKTVVGAAAEPPAAAARNEARDAAPEAGRARAVAPASAPARVAAAKEADLPPEKWLERIEALRKEGKLDEAAKSLAEFRKRYPDFVLPAHLKDGIRQ